MGIERLTDTIVAPITPPGRGAIAVIRVSGPQSMRIARHVFPSLPSEPKFRYAYYGTFVHGDEGLCTMFGEGASFTGELCAEFSIHGSPESVRLLLSQCESAGARPAERGEFSMRAFLGGSIDLTQAEGILATVDAHTEGQLQVANQLRHGLASEALNRIAAEIRKSLTTIEALTDFSEELGEISIEDKAAGAVRGQQLIEEFLATEGFARTLREGVRIVIAGQPNAGKSSLLNALLKEERAIVTEIPGTTRDTIEEQASIAGIPVRMIDTAGLRDSDDVVEQIGIERTRTAMAASDLIIYLYDASVGFQSADEDQLGTFAERAIVAAAKSDLVTETPSRGIPISSRFGTGLDALIAEMEARISAHHEPPPTTIVRHYQVLREVQPMLEEALTAIESDSLPDDLAAVTLRGALRRIGELTGDTASAEVLEQIFSQFCIGK